MLEKLLAFLMHSKSAAVSAIFVVGTTGALVSATTQNGVTTVTVKPATESTTTSHDQVTAVTLKADDNDKNKNEKDEDRAAENNGTTKASVEACQAQHKAAQAAFHDVNTTFHELASDLVKAAQGKGEKGREALRANLKTLKGIRHDALKAIEATVTCGDEDEDKDEDADDDDARANPQAVAGEMNGTQKSTVTFTGTDPKAIVDQAVAAMKVVFNTAKGTLDALPTVTPKQNESKPEHKRGESTTQNTQHKSGDGQRDRD